MRRAEKFDAPLPTSAAMFRELHAAGSQPTQWTQDYWTEKDQFPAADLDDGTFIYG